MNRAIKIAHVDDLIDGEHIGIIVDRTRILLLKLNGKYFAYEDKCPHQGVPLSEGTLQDSVITCSAHQWCFNAQTGTGINPEEYSLKKVQLYMKNQEIFVVLPEVSYV